MKGLTGKDRWILPEDYNSLWFINFWYFLKAHGSSFSWFESWKYEVFRQFACQVTFTVKLWRSFIYIISEEALSQIKKKRLCPSRKPKMTRKDWKIQMAVSQELENSRMKIVHGSTNRAWESCTTSRGVRCTRKGGKRETGNRIKYSSVTSKQRGETILLYFYARSVLSYLELHIFLPATTP